MSKSKEQIRLTTQASSSCIAILVFLVLFSGGLAQAQNAISLRAGSFTPWRGETGSSATLQYTHRVGQRHHLGAEFEYRRFEGKVADVSDIDIENFLFRFFYRVDLALDSMVTPYVGLGFGAGSNKFNRGKFEQALNLRKPGSDFDFKTAAVVDMLGLLGLDVSIPQAEWVSLFGEARFNYSAQFTTLQDQNQTASFLFPRKKTQSEFDNAGGVAGHLGVRFRF